MKSSPSSVYCLERPPSASTEHTIRTKTSLSHCRRQEAIRCSTDQNVTKSDAQVGTSLIECLGSGELSSFCRSQRVRRPSENIGVELAKRSAGYTGGVREGQHPCFSSEASSSRGSSTSPAGRRTYLRRRLRSVSNASREKKCPFIY